MNFSINKKFMAGSLAAFLTLGAASAYAAPVERESIAQIALLQSLAQGYFSGTITAGELRALGDTGIGTFDGLNGEMIVLDGTIYQALGDGRVIVTPDDTHIPYATVTFFDRDVSVNLNKVENKAAFEKILNDKVKECGENSFYMVKLHTVFPSILYRSEYGTKEPNVTLVEALKDKQTEFTQKDIKGTLVGIYCPNYMNGLNTPGWHFHFISDDKKHGGHILEFSVNDGTVLMDKTDKFTMILPDDKKFQNMNLAKDMNEDIKKAERDTKGKL